MARLALIAHDDKKDDLASFCKRHRKRLEAHQLVATGTTGGRLKQETGLKVRRFLSGPLGGDAQIAAQVATGKIDGVIFLVDPLNAHPHEPDIRGLLRVCNVHDVLLATNLSTAEVILRKLDRLDR